MRITPATETLRSAPERLVKPLVLQVTAIPGVFSILHKRQAHGGRSSAWAWARSGADEGPTGTRNSPKCTKQPTGQARTAHRQPSYRRRPLHPDEKKNMFIVNNEHIFFSAVPLSTKWRGKVSRRGRAVPQVKLTITHTLQIPSVRLGRDGLAQAPHP